MKDIIRTGIFILIGVILLVALIWAVMPNRGPEGTAEMFEPGSFVPGTYTSYIILHNRPVSISVTVDDGAILDIAISDMAESLEVFYPLIRPTMAELSQKVIDTQSTNIETGIKTQYTSRILLDAINMALHQALVPAEES
jgi:uncharacterized protein with FMN-binding domain